MLTSHNKRHPVSATSAVKNAGSVMVELPNPTYKGELEYQACDDKVCHRPETLPIEWKVTLSPLVVR